MNLQTVPSDMWTHIEGSILEVHHMSGRVELVGALSDGTLSLDAADFVWHVRPCNGSTAIGDR